nr:hypothetical protein [Haladaptatus halobius]
MLPLVILNDIVLGEFWQVNVDESDPCLSGGSDIIDFLMDVVDQLGKLGTVCVFVSEISQESAPLSVSEQLEDGLERAALG